MIKKYMQNDKPVKDVTYHLLLTFKCTPRLCLLF